MEGFTTNFTTASLVELLTIHNSTADTSPGTTAPVAAVFKCEDMDHDNPAAAKCLVCNHYLCKECTVEHKGRKGTRNHKIATLAELKEGGTKQLEQKRYCADHEGEELKLYCRTCQEVICRDCTIVTHKQHDYTFIKDVREELIMKMERLVASMSRKEAKCQGLQDSIPLVREKEKQKLATEKASINMFFDQHVEELQRLLDALQQHRATVLNNLYQASAVHTKQLLADEESLQISHTLLTSARSFAQQQLSSASSTDLAMMSKHVIQQLETLRKHKLTSINNSLWGVWLSEKDPTSSQIQTLLVDDVANRVQCQINNGALLGKNTFQIINQVSKNLKLDPAVAVTLSSGESCPVKIEPSGSHWSVTYFIANYPQPHNDDMDSSDDEMNTAQPRSRAATALATVKVSVKVNGVQAKNSPFKLQLRKEMAVGTRVELHDSSQQGTVAAFQSYHSGRHRVVSLAPNHASVKWDNGTSNQLEMDLLTVLTE